ncbi:MAG: hypothetical protein OEM98_17460 [Gammaproteobacteria bacterium]|nr:hypothetical protein [Gammaproteobacteria bacterium]
MDFAGLSTSLAHTTVAAMRTELYGLMRLGAIESLSAALGVFGSAPGPVTMGAEMSIEKACLALAAHTIVGSVLVGMALGGAGASRGSVSTRSEDAHEWLRVSTVDFRQIRRDRRQKYRRSRGDASPGPGVAAGPKISTAFPLCGRPHSALTCDAVAASPTYAKGERS